MRAIYAPCNDTLEMPLVVSDSDIRFPEAFFFSLQLVFAMFSTGFVEKGWWQKKVYTFIEGKFISGVSSAYSCWLWFVCAFLVLPGGCRPWWIPVWQRNDICWCEGAFLLCNKICCVSPSAKVIKAARSHFYYFYRTLHMVPSQMRCASFWKSKCYRHFPFMYTGLCAVEPSCLKPLGRCRPHRWDCTCRCILMCLHSYLCWFVVNQYKSSRIAASEVSFGLSTWMGSTHYNNTLIAGKFPPATAAFHARMARFPVVQELFADTGAEWISLFRQGHKKENLVTHLCMQPNPQQSCTPKQRILRFWQFCLIVNLWWFVDLFS